LSKIVKLPSETDTGQHRHSSTKTCCSSGVENGISFAPSCSLLAEGEALTIVYLSIFSYYIVNWVILRMNEVSLVMPLRNVGVIFVYFAIDLIQDFIADKIGKRFSEWSYFYKEGGFMGREMRIIATVLFWSNACWQGYVMAFAVSTQLQVSASGNFVYFHSFSVVQPFFIATTTF